MTRPDPLPWNRGTQRLFDVVYGHAVRRPDAIAISAPGQSPLTYFDLNRRLDTVIEELDSLGVKPGDRVALALPAGATAAVATIAVASHTVCVSINPELGPVDLAAQLQHARCNWMLVPTGENRTLFEVAKERGVEVIELRQTDDSQAGAFTMTGDKTGVTKVAPAAPQHDIDIALALHTSGTSGRPKLALLSHQNLCCSARNIADVLHLNDTDVCLSVMPLFHIHGLSAVFASLTVGSSVVLMGRFSAGGFFHCLREFRPSWYTASPAIHQSILQEARAHPESIGESGLRFLRSASAALPAEVRDSLEGTFGAPVIEAYGMTEASPQIASNRLPPALRKPGSVGPAAGPEIAIQDEGGRLLPAGETGEIVVRGPNVISNYQGKRPGATIGAARGEWFHTSDTGYIDADGYLYVTGRLTELINRGGEKIAPTEIEDVLLEHPGTQQAMVFAIPHAQLGEGVAAAVVLKANAVCTEVDLRRFVASRLAAFKVPQQIVFVAEIPLSSSGKPCRAELASTLGLAGIGVGARPVSEIERKVSESWSDVLGIQDPGLNDDFFHNGGHSLSALQLLARLSDEFGIDFANDVLFDFPTIASLAGYIRETLVPDSTGIYDAETPRRAPAAVTQESLFFMDQLHPGNAAYTISSPLWLEGELNRGALERSLNELRRRHDTLRTTFSVSDGKVQRTVSPYRATPLSEVDLAGLSAESRKAKALELAAEEARRPFDLGTGPLFRATLLCLDRKEHVLLLTAHHIVSDDWSVGILFRELCALYEAFSETRGRDSPLPDLPCSYDDFVDWQRKGDMHTQHAYWMRQLANPPAPVELPADRSRPPVQTYVGGEVRDTITDSVVSKLKALSHRENLTLFMVMMAGFQVLLSRHSGQADLIVGVPVANRRRLQYESLIGMFVNTLAFRGDLSGDPSFRELLGRVKRTARDAFNNQDLPFETLVRSLRPERSADDVPLIRIMFAFQNVPYQNTGHFNLGPSLNARPLRVHNGGAKFDLTVYIRDTADGLETTWQYNKDLFHESTVERLAHRYRTLLREAVSVPDQRVSSLRIITPEEESLVSGWGRGPVLRFSAGSFPDLFARQANRSPEAIAIRFADKELTYRQLNERSNQLARYLRRFGVHRGARVGICLPRSILTLISVLGVLKSGAACVVLDPEYPEERISSTLGHARLNVLIADQRLTSELDHAASLPVVRLGDDLSILAGEDSTDLDIAIDPGDLAYLIYTSGSTGSPKGVMITHANLYHCARAMRESLGVTPRDRYLHTASFAFSSSVRQYAVPLGCGATVVLAAPGDVRKPRSLLRLVTHWRVTIVDFVPSYLRVWLAELDASQSTEELLAGLGSLRLILSASERLAPDLVEELRLSVLRRVRLINMYGQTETTGIVSCCEVPRSPGNSTAVPIGEPVPNTRVYVLDGEGRPVPPGVVGQLWISGNGVSQGYFDEPELTGRVFRSDTFDALQPMYRSGDRGRHRSDGKLEFLGRSDDQIKIQGYRVEPAEIETVMQQHPCVAESAVVGQSAGDGTYLVAFVAPREGARDNVEAVLRPLLRSKLPAYMIPRVFIELEALPRTASGKIDRRILSQRIPDHPLFRPLRPLEDDATPRPQATEILQRIWSGLLGTETVSPGDNFFELGGDSILSVQMVHEAKLAGLKLELRHVFEHQTIGELVKTIGLRDSRAGNPVLMRRRSDGFEEAPSSEASIRVAIDSLRDYGCEALEAAGLSKEGAAVVTEVQLEANLRNQPTHNMDSIPRYARGISAGKINPRPRIRLEKETPVSAQIDGDNGPGQWVATVAVETAIRKAKESGIATVAVRRSNHFGAAGHYTWLVAQQGLIGLCTTNGPNILAPTGGVTPTFGNNPFSAGIPAGHYRPVVLDIAISVAPRGKIGLQLAEGKPLPPGWILDRDGQPSVDPADLISGLGVPIGGHKGYGLALIMEVLAGVLGGAGFCLEHGRDRMQEDVAPRDIGHFFTVIDPKLFSPQAHFLERMDRMIEETKSGPRIPGVDEILIPGEAELRARDHNLVWGVPLRLTAYKALVKYGQSVGLKTRLSVVSEEA